MIKFIFPWWQHGTTSSKLIRIWLMNPAKWFWFDSNYFSISILMILLHEMVRKDWWNKSSCCFHNFDWTLCTTKCDKTMALWDRRTESQMACVRLENGISWDLTWERARLKTSGCHFSACWENSWRRTMMIGVVVNNFFSTIKWIY